MGRPGTALAIANAAVDGCRADQWVGRHIRELTSRTGWDRVERVLIIGVGKASPAMAGPALQLLDAQLSDALIVTADTSRVPSGMDRARVVIGDHPVPGVRSAAAAEEIIETLRRFSPTSRDLVLFLVSGGTSSMLSRPRDPLEPEDLADLTRVLLNSGMDVTRINHLRGSLSTIHGGRVLHHAAPAECISLVLCDNVQVGVIGVGSGFTIPEATDPSIGRACLDEAADWLDHRLLQRVRAALPPPDEVHAPSSEIIEVAGPAMAHTVALREATRTDIHLVDLGSRVQGEAREVADRIIEEINAARRAQEGPGILIGVGEATVTVSGSGQGGRCQELAWAILPGLSQIPGGNFVALASDGQDFTSGVMGAQVDQTVWARVQQECTRTWADVLDANDSGTELGRMGLLVPSRDTGTNVCDIYVATWEA